MLLYIPTYPSMVYIWQYDTMLNLRINDSGLYYVILELRDTSYEIKILYLKTLSYINRDTVSTWKMIFLKTSSRIKKIVFYILDLFLHKWSPPVYSCDIFGQHLPRHYRLFV